MCVHRHYKDFETMQNQLDTIKFTPEKSKQIALARLDLIHKWLEFRRKAKNKLQADYDFVNLHNTSNSHLFQILGKISRGSLHRWHAMLSGTDDYQKLLPQYKYASVNDYRTVLTDEEIKIFMGLLLHPNRISIGKATVLIKYNLFDLTHIKVYTLKGEFLCTAERVAETHPMAKILGTVEDMEDFKQKIQKQKRLKRKTINSLKAYLPQEEIKLIKHKIEQPVVQTGFKECSTKECLKIIVKSMSI